MKNDKTFEAKMTELEERIAWFHSDEFSLELAAEKFDQLSKLAQDIEQQLSEMKQQVEVLKKRFDD